MARTPEEKAAADLLKQEVEALKKIKSLGELQLEVDRLALKEQMTAKEKDAFFNKHFLANLAGTKALLSEGGNIAKLTTGMQKTVISAYQNLGEEVNEGDERRARQTQKDLMEIAFQVKKANIIDLKDKGKMSDSMAGLRMAALETGNFFQKGWLNFQDTVADAADIKNLGDALSQDFSLLTTEFQGLMALPGMKSIVTGIKFIAAWLGKLGYKTILAWLKKRKAAKKGLAGAGDDLTDEIALLAPKSDLAEGVKDVAEKGKGTIEEGLMASRDEFMEGKGAVKAITPKTASAAAATKGPRLGARGMARAAKQLTKAVKKLTKSIRRFVRLLGRIFAAGLVLGLMKKSKIFKKMGGLFMKGLKLLTGFFAKMAKALVKMAVRFGVIILGWIVNMGIWLAGMAVFIATLIMANLPLIALIVLIVLIAIGLYLLFKKVQDNWETIKVKMAMAMDRLKLVGTKIVNWFSDAATDIGYKIKLLIAKMKDGIAGIGNAIITAINDKKKAWFGGDDLIDMRLETGAVGKVEATRTDDLAKRKARDEKLESDFETKQIERGKQLEEAKIKDSERNAQKDAETSQGQIINTSISTDNREISLSAEGTRPTDSQTLVAIHTGQ